MVGERKPGSSAPAALTPPSDRPRAAASAARGDTAGRSLACWPAVLVYSEPACAASTPRPALIARFLPAPPLVMGACGPRPPTGVRAVGPTEGRPRDTALPPPGVDVPCAAVAPACCLPAVRGPRPSAAGAWFSGRVLTGRRGAALKPHGVSPARLSTTAPPPTALLPSKAALAALIAAVTLLSSALSLGARSCLPALLGASPGAVKAAAFPLAPSACDPRLEGVRLPAWTKTGLGGCRPRGPRGPAGNGAVACTCATPPLRARASTGGGCGFCVWPPSVGSPAAADAPRPTALPTLAPPTLPATLGRRSAREAETRTPSPGRVTRPALGAASRGSAPAPHPASAPRGATGRAGVSSRHRRRADTSEEASSAGARDTGPSAPEPRRREASLGEPSMRRREWLPSERVGEPSAVSADLPALLANRAA